MKQVDIYLDKQDTSNLWSQISVKIHGYIMSKIDTNYAAKLHENTLMPFSLYTVDMGTYLISRISALDEKSKSIFSAFADSDEIRIVGTKRNLHIGQISYGLEYSFDQVLSFMDVNKYKIVIRTPAMYKSKGDLHYDPTLYQYFESVRQKIYKFENIEISKEQMIEAFSQVKILDYNLSTQAFLSGGRKCPGIIGYYNIQLPQSGEESAILRKLLSYATYSGIGGQTTQGMGGFTVEKIGNRT